MNKGLVHFYLGDGKGKSTALFGLALRALGRNFKVLIIQVLKMKETGEILYLQNLKDKNLKIIRIKSSEKFSWEMTEEEILYSKNEILNSLLNIEVDLNSYDLVLFDELLNAENIGFILDYTIISLILNKKDSVEMVFTGRNTSSKLKKYADYISVINSEKHPFDLGIPARIGIEY